MILKKFAMLTLTVVAFTGFGISPVSAVASETVSGQTVSVNGDVETDNAGDVLNDEDVTLNNEELTDNNGASLNEDAENDKVTSESKKSSKDKTKTIKESKRSKKSKAKSSKNKYTKAELRLMASIINCEAGAESFQGKLAVGIVIMNRIQSKKFPNTLKGVIYQAGQFSPVRNGMLKKKLAQYDAGEVNSKQWKNCISAAKKVLKGQHTIIYNGKVKNMQGFYFFSVQLSGARMRLGGHKFK